MLLIWRHPRVQGAVSRCVGRSEVPVDRRRAKRLAHRVRQLARRERLPREVWTSPQARCRDVGRWLRRFGFVHHVDADLCELDFGAWEGRAWADIDAGEVADWEADFLHHAPGGGESLARLMERVQRFRAAHGAALVVGHAGWMTALRCIGEGRTPGAADWPRAPACGSLLTDPQTGGASRNTR